MEQLFESNAAGDVSSLWVGSSRAFERAKRVIPGGSMRHTTWFAPHPPYARRGSGCWIEDLDGGRILDGANNFFSLIHGHAFPPVIKAICEAATEGTAFGLPTPHETRLAEAISERSPRCEHVRFCNSGTEALMFAVKAARALTGRSAIAKFEGAYHGSYDFLEVSLASTSANWSKENGDPASTPYAKGVPASVLSEVIVLPYADAQRCSDILSREGNRLAAVVIDTMASRIGMVPPSTETLKAISDACDRHGILLICDEVISFRLSYAGMYAKLGLKPDFVTLGKIIGGGMPVGAVCGPVDRMKVFDHTLGAPAVAFGGTFSANPLSMAAGAATLTAYDAPAIDRLSEMGEGLRGGLNQMFAQRGIPAQLTGAGSLFRLHLSRTEIVDYRSSTPTDAAKRALASIHAKVLLQGVLLTPNCSGALSTPMDEPEVSLLSSALAEAVIDVFEAAGWQ